MSEACKIVGCSQQQFYEIRRNFQTYGAEGLLERLSGPKNPHPNRLSAEEEEAILAYALEQPTHGAQRTADELLLRGMQVSSGGIRGVWSRHNLLSKHERLLRLEETTRKRKLTLTEVQIRLLERFSPEFRERHLEVHCAGGLVAVDTFFVGTLEGVGKVYLQTVLDCFSRYAWARFLHEQAADHGCARAQRGRAALLREPGARIHTILSDNGREFCGRPDQHPYELFLQLEQIEHCTTKVRRPQSNGFIERFHRTLLDEHLRPSGRTKWYESTQEMQLDLNAYLEQYNRTRPHRDRNRNGRTPEQVFRAGLPQPSTPPAEEASEAT